MNAKPCHMCQETTFAVDTTGKPYCGCLLPRHVREARAVAERPAAREIEGENPRFAKCDWCSRTGLCVDDEQRDPICMTCNALPGPT